MTYEARLRGSRFVWMLQGLMKRWPCRNAPVNENGFIIIEFRTQGYSWGAISAITGVTEDQCRYRAKKAADAKKNPRHGSNRNGESTCKIITL